MSQMVSTRSTPCGFGGGGNEPPPPGFAEILAVQTELLRLIVEGRHHQQQHGNQPQAASYSDFLGT